MVATHFAAYACAADGSPVPEPPLIATVRGGSGVAPGRVENFMAPMDDKLESQDPRPELKYRLLLEISQRISRTLDLETILSSLLQSIRSVIEYDAGGIFILRRKVPLRPKSQGLLIEGMTRIGFDDKPAEEDPMLRSGKGIVGHVILTGETVIAPDVTVDPHYVCGRAATRSEIAVPVVSDNQIIGSVNLESDRLNAFSPADAELLQFFASATAISIERSMLHQELLAALGAAKFDGVIGRLGNTWAVLTEAASAADEAAATTLATNHNAATLSAAQQSAAAADALRTAALTDFAASALQGKTPDQIATYLQNEINGWGSLAVWPLLAVAAVLGFAFVLAEQGSAEPMLPVRLLRGPLGNAALLTLTGQMLSIVVGFHLPHYLRIITEHRCQVDGSHDIYYANSQYRIPLIVPDRRNNHRYAFICPAVRYRMYHAVPYQGFFKHRACIIHIDHFPFFKSEPFLVPASHRNRKRYQFMNHFCQWKNVLA